MSRTLQIQTPSRSIQNALITAMVGLTLATANTAHAQRALGLPYVGRNQFSVSVTERSRDGVSTEKEAVFGVSFGRQVNSNDAPVQLSVIARAAARALEGDERGIFDAEFTVAVSHNVRAIDGLSVSGAAGVAATVWGKDERDWAEMERGRIVNSVPLSIGMSYDVRVGGATFAPFVTTTHAYSRGRDYVNDEPINKTSGLLLGHSAGVSVRFRETVVSLSNIYREAGMPNRNRLAFSAGMSW